MIPRYDLNDTNFIILAMKFYNNVNLALTEFESDIKRVKYIKRLINQFKSGNKDLKERLLLNHIIILSNTFGVDFTTKMLFHRVAKADWDVLKVFLMYLNFLPDHIDSINGVVVNTREIPLNQVAIDRLRKV